MTALQNRIDFLSTDNQVPWAASDAGSSIHHHFASSANARWLVELQRQSGGWISRTMRALLAWSVPCALPGRVLQAVHAQIARVHPWPCPSRLDPPTRRPER